MIGFTEVPLRGVLQGGRLAASLSIWQDPARKKYSKLIPAGSVGSSTRTPTQARPLTLILALSLTLAPPPAPPPAPTLTRSRVSS